MHVSEILQIFWWKLQRKWAEEKLVTDDICWTAGHNQHFMWYVVKFICYHCFGWYDIVRFNIHSKADRSQLGPSNNIRYIAKLKRQKQKKTMSKKQL